MTVGRLTTQPAYSLGVLVLFATFVINHFDLFGLRQTWLASRQQPQAPVAFKTPLLYRLVRHPLLSGGSSRSGARPP